MQDLSVVHRSDNFLVVDKPPDLIINSDDPDRDSVYLRLQRQFPDLADTSKYAVCKLNRNPHERPFHSNILELDYFTLPIHP